jgi:Fe-S oxidoreductase
MCPSYRATGEEKDSTRGRARLLQELLDGELLPDGWDSVELAEVLDLCLSCKACAGECPAGVDVASLKAEVLYQRYRRRIRPRSHYALGWLPTWARLASIAPRTANALLAAPPTGRLLRLVAGIDRRRGLPRLATRRWRGRSAGTASSDRGTASAAPHGPVLLWLDEFTEHFAPEVARAAIVVLQRAGYRVRLPTGPVRCAVSWISTGQLDTARRQLERSLRVIDAELAAGMPVVGLEPSCTAVLRGELTELVDTPDARRLAGRTVTLAELLERTPGWTPPSLDGIRVVAQPHCHHRSVLGWQADSRLLAAAGAQVDEVAGCCGLAGNFGMERGHYEVSVSIAEQHLLPAVRAAGPEALVLADGFSCRTQLTDLAGRDSVHLAQLLAEAYSRDEEPG